MILASHRHHASKRGLSMVELMVVIAIFSVFCGLLVWGLSAAFAGPKQKATAEAEARNWAKGLGLKLLGVECANVDSDGDGYVSCTANVEGQGVVPIECRGAYSVGHGCRSPKLRTFTQPMDRSPR